jgi:hypothetical protein
VASPIEAEEKKGCSIDAEIKPPNWGIYREDVKAFIVSNNINRRHLNSGQRAVAVAMMYAKPR